MGTFKHILFTCTHLSILFKDLVMCLSVLLIVCLCTVCMPSVDGCQKRTLDSLEMELIDGYGPSCGCWKLNLGFLQEQVILTAKLSLQRKVY